MKPPTIEIHQIQLKGAVSFGVFAISGLLSSWYSLQL
jgi:hypothetical protein